MKPRKFKKMYLAPLKAAIKANSISCDLSLRTYEYPKGDPVRSEQVIQDYFNDRSPPLKKLFNKLYDECSKFGELELFSQPFYRTKLIKYDIVDLYNYYMSMNFQHPDLCISLGDFKKGDYKLADGFKEFKNDIKDYKKILEDHRKSGLQTPPPEFIVGPWSEKAAFAFVLRKYLLDAFLCGTGRVYISDYQNFSGFFQYEFIGEQMIINYYVIDDPETVVHGFTLRSAEAGFFYKDIAKATATKEKLYPLCEKTKSTAGRKDPFASSHANKSRSDLSTGKESDLSTIEEDAEGNIKQVIEGNTKCRVIYDAPSCYPSLGIDLPLQVFVKMYHYSSRSWEMHDLIYLNTPTKHEYYRIFFNELEINKKVADSEYASHFPKLFASGCWNGLYERPIHIIEYLGKELPEEKWEKKKVYKVIKTRIKELHSLVISHNDVRTPNIHVSESEKITLIDFGLSDAKNIESHKLRDLRLLDEIFKVGKYSPKGRDRCHKRHCNKRSNKNYPSLIMKIEIEILRIMYNRRAQRMEIMKMIHHLIEMKKTKKIVINQSIHSKM